MRKTMIKKNNGITLIALVITIVVLLILAGVSIAFLTGENGIITQATTAREKNEIASVKEQAQLDIANWVADQLLNGGDTTVASADDVKNILNEALNAGETKYWKDFSDTGIITPNGYEVPFSELYTNGSGGNIKEYTEDGVPIPAGFYYVGGTKGEGVVISDKAEDANKGTSHEVAQTLIGNQFVWVPVESDDDFKQYSGYMGGMMDSEFWESIGVQNFLQSISEPYENGYANEVSEYNAMKTSVLENDGFYVGRYEAGSETERTESSDITDSVVIKQGANVYNYIGWSNSNDMTVETGGAVQKSKNFAEENGYTSVTSTLIYGVQWDAIMQWIDNGYKNETGTLNSFVANSDGKGNYTGSLARTGSNASYAVKNIYDLAGNVLEWTMEPINTDGWPEEKINFGFNYGRVPRGRRLQQCSFCLSSF